MDTRKSLRQRIRQERRALTPRQQRQHAQALKRRLCTQLWFRKAKRIALYLPNDGEISPEPLIQLCWSLGKQVYLPVLHPIAHNRLWFIRYTPATRLRLNTYRILEPQQTAAPRCSAWALDLVFLPLVAFDEQGGRLGMGGGYYDRTFAFKLAETGLQGPKLVGLAHELQKQPALEVAFWDVPLFAIATERDCYTA